MTRLKSYGIDSSAQRPDGGIASVFRDKNDIDVFRKLVIDLPLLDIGYSIYCTKLAAAQLNEDVEALSEQIKTALMLAELLEYFHRFYMNEPRKADLLRRDQRVYRELLDIPVDEKLNDKIDPSISENIRDLTATANFLRNFVTRLRRLLVTTIPLARDFNRYCSWTVAMDRVSTPILSYAAWIFFIPRTLTNLFLTAKHVIPGSWMSTEEQSLLWRTRFWAQMELRWVELGNDLAWISLSFLNCFFLTGPLAPIGLFGSATLLAYDVGIATLRVYIEISRLYGLEEDYQGMLSGYVPTSPEYKQISSYRSHLQDRITFEQKRLYIHVINTSILLFSFILTFPLFAFNPIIPVIGAVLSVLSTLACYIAVHLVAKEKPVDKVISLSLSKKPSNVTSLGFFGSIQDAKQAIGDALTNEKSSQSILPST